MSLFVTGFETGLASGFWTVVLERCSSVSKHAWRYISSIMNEREEFRKLEKSFFTTRELMSDMEEIVILGKSRGRQMWYEDLRDLACDLEILLDRIAMEYEKFSFHGEEGIQFVTKLQAFVKRASFTSDIQKIQQKLDKLMEEHKGMAMNERACKRSKLIGSSESSETSRSVEPRIMVGRIEDGRRIIDLMTSRQLGPIGVVSLVGMAGIGKTVLARSVYLEMDPFGCKIWVHVGQYFDSVRILRHIIEQLTQKGCTLVDLDALQNTVRDLARRKRLLVVLDDYWSEVPKDWDTIVLPLESTAYGSFVIVTTRSLEVSSIVCSSRATDRARSIEYKLGFLSDQDCCGLVEQIAVPSFNIPDEIRNVIGSKCGGLPLAAASLGTALRSAATQSEWEFVLRDDTWEMPQDRIVLDSLMKSYLQLPYPQRRCFQYCAMFPDGHIFNVDDLVHLWMAVGYILRVASMEVEDVGKAYFNDLLARNFFQSTPDGASYTMHVLIHNFARLVASGVCQYSRSDQPLLLFGSLPHLSMLYDGHAPLHLKETTKNKRLQSLLVSTTNGNNQNEFDSKLFGKSKFVRVLSLRNFGFTQLPGSVKELVYLRHLDVSDNPITRLPSFITKLFALQSLKLRNCPGLSELPDGLVYLKKLRHLELDTGCHLQTMPLDFGLLTELQTLTLFVVGVGERRTVRELQAMDLRGSLLIKDIQNVLNQGDASGSRLNSKPRLETLELQWSIPHPQLAGDDLNQESERQADVLSGFVPHVNLKGIVIRNYSGLTFPPWLSDQFRGFTKVELVGLQRCTNLPSLGELRVLEKILIMDLIALTDIGQTLYGTSQEVKFPSLTSCELRNLPQLVNWHDVDDNAMPNISTFCVASCPLLATCPLRLMTAPNRQVQDCPQLPLQQGH